MVGTLVGMLPSTHTGAELIVSDQGASPPRARGDIRKLDADPHAVSADGAVDGGASAAALADGDPDVCVLTSVHAVHGNGQSSADLSHPMIRQPS